MNERIKQIRKENEDSQDSLANKLGLTRTYVNLIESGKKIPSDRTIKDICRIYKVNEEWLRTGNGEMKKPRSENQIIAEFVNEVMESKSDDFKKRLINALSQLDEDEWKVLEDLANNLK